MNKSVENIKDKINFLRPYLVRMVLFSVSSSTLIFLAEIYKFSRLNYPIGVRSIFISIFIGISIFFVISLLIIRMEIKKKTTHDRFSRPPYSWVSESIFLVLIGSLLLMVMSVLQFIKRGASAYEYPATDMGPFFERFKNVNFLSNDFFTNASSLPNPRFIFGYFIQAFVELINSDWYSILYGLKTIFIILMPVLFFIILILILRQYFIEGSFVNSIFFSWLTVVTLFSERVLGIFSLGWWSPIIYYAAPQTLSLFLSLLAIIAFFINKKIISYLFWFAATLFQPAISINVFIFWMTTLKNKTFRELAIPLTFGIAVPGILLNIFFSSPVKLTANDFVYHYVIENHAPHYLPTEFGIFASVPWYLVFGGILVFLLCFSIFEVYAKNYKFSLLGLYLAAPLITVVVIQYLFVELWPIKIFAILGLSRYLMFGFWSLALAVCVLAGQILPTQLLRFDLSVKNTKYYYSLMPALFFVVLFIVLQFFKDNPVNDISKKNINFSNWVATTPSEAVFLTPPGYYSINLPLIFKRAVFTGNGFPFREDIFVEYDKRKIAAFGSTVENRNLPGMSYEKTTSFYNSRTIDYVNRLSLQFRVDYVMFEKGANKYFFGNPVVYSDEFVEVYQLHY